MKNSNVLLCDYNKNYNGINIDMIDICNITNKIGIIDGYSNIVESTKLIEDLFENIDRYSISNAKAMVFMFFINSNSNMEHIVNFLDSIDKITLKNCEIIFGTSVNDEIGIDNIGYKLIMAGILQKDLFMEKIDLQIINPKNDINIEFYDVSYALNNKGRVSGYSNIVDCKNLYDDIVLNIPIEDFKNAKTVICSYITNPKISMFEISDVMEKLYNELFGECEIIFGTSSTYDLSDNEIGYKILATGILEH